MRCRIYLHPNIEHGQNPEQATRPDVASPVAARGLSPAHKYLVVQQSRQWLQDHKQCTEEAEDEVKRERAPPAIHRQPRSHAHCDESDD